MKLKNIALKGLFWMTSNMSSLFILSFVKVFILARYLSADEIGILSILIFLNSLFVIISELGVGNVIVRQQETSNVILSSLFWLRFIMSIFLYIILFYLTWIIANFYNEPRLEFLIKISAISSIFMNISDFFRVICQKNLNFKIIAMISIFSEIIGLILVYFLLINGYGLYAAIIGILVTASLSGLFYFIHSSIYGLLPRFVIDLSFIILYLKPSSYQMSEKLFNYFSSNLDKILIAKFLGMGALGIYELAWKLMIAPVRQLNPIIHNVSYPIYSKIKDNKLKQEIYINIIKFIGLITIPLFTYIFVNPNLVILILYGEGWGKVAEILLPLLIVGAVKTLTNPTGAYMMSNNRFDLTFNWNVLSFAILISCLLISLYLAPSLENVSLTVLIANIIIGFIIHKQVASHSNLNYFPIIKNTVTTITLAVLCIIIAHTFINFATINNDNVKIIFAITYFFLYFVSVYILNYTKIKSFLRN